MSNQQGRNTSVTVIEPPGKWHFFDFSEFRTHHELLYFLTWRDIKVRYKQALLGIGWAVIQPIMLMIVFTFIFGKMAQVNSEGVPYPIFAFVAILPWNLFSTSLNKAGQSLVSNAGLLQKVYVPRLIIPVASVLPNLVDFFIGSVILGGMMIYYHSSVHLSWTILLLPIFTLLALLSALAAGLWLAALNVKYRDIKQVSPFLVRLWMWVSPVAYSATEVPTGIWKVIYGLNPMAGVIQGFRWAIVGGERPDVLIFLSIGIVLILLITGLIYFRKTEAYFADIV
ncbi:MAG: ABC transporter permease [Candidatus Aegiribacteria sp.]|nr:ABC transporter permease [Candidatus Aegiribacteria sp.]